MHLDGFGISGSYLMPTARLLARHAVNIVPDLPGYGRSPRRDHTLGIPELAEAVLGLIDALAVAKVVLLGNSMGCPICRRSPTPHRSGWSCSQLTLFPSLELLAHTSVPTLAVLGSRDPLMPGPARVIEVARLSPVRPGWDRSGQVPQCPGLDVREHLVGSLGAHLALAPCLEHHGPLGLARAVQHGIQLLGVSTASSPRVPEVEPCRDSASASCAAR